MAVPYMKNTLRGWVKPTSVKLVIQSVINHKTVSTETSTILKLNKQPLKASIVERKPPEQRTWKWWSIIVKDGILLKTDDVIIIAGLRYKIQSARDWTESGFQKYEAIEGYQ